MVVGQLRRGVSRFVEGTRTLRVRTLAILCVAFALFLVGQWFSARILYAGSFAKAELRSALAQARHSQAVVNYPLGYLRRVAIDNAMWDETYRFLQGRNAAYPEVLLSMSDSFRMLHASAYVFIDLDGKVRLARQFDARRDKLVGADPAILAAFERGGPIRERLHAGAESTGYTRIAGVVFNWCAAPVLHSDGAGPSNGWWVMLSALDDAFFARATEALGSRVALALGPASSEPFAEPHVPARAEEVSVRALGDALLETRLPLGRLDAGQTLELVITSDRDVYAVAARASRYLLWTAIGFGTVLSFLALVFVERRVLGPLEAASKDLERIGRSGKLSARLTPPRHDDEIGRLVETVNGMLAELEAREDTERAMLSAIPDALLRVDEQGTVLGARLPEDSPKGLPWPSKGESLAARFPPDVAARLLGALGTPESPENKRHVEFDMAVAGRKAACFEARISRINARESLVLLRDITTRKEIESRVARLAYFDSLTQLPNRAAFMSQLSRQVQRAARAGTRFGLVYLDLDGFKQVNDTMGHDRGDQLLLKAAERLRAALRPLDTVGRAGQADEGNTLSRLGGDEFTMLILDIDGPEDLLAIVHRIGAIMRRPFEIDGREFTLTTSIGVAVYPEDGMDAQALLKNADTAMYHAKRQGRDNGQFYRAHLTEQALTRLDLENSLRAGIARGEFHLVYQPIIDLASGQLECVEALVRWNHPTRGAIPPAKFIPLAEETGAIDTVGRWVLETACCDLARWRGAGLDLRLAVNVSPRQFGDAKLVDSVMQVLARNDVPASRLILEITEGAVMEAFMQTTAVLDTFREHGIRIALDDFGAGYSSLGYLTQIPIDIIKIDRSFVSRLPQDSGSTSIVRAILALAEALGVEVTAEGVETELQAKTLQAMACRHVQGYHFSRPVAPQDIPALAARDWRRVAAPAAAAPAT